MGLATRAPRQSAGGGRALLLLGVLLALAAGGLVIYVVSQYTGGGQTVTVIVANTQLSVGTTLTIGGANGTTAISTAFGETTVNASFAPAGAFPFTTQAALNSYLNNQMVSQVFLKGDILRSNDPRLSTGSAPGSLTNLNTKMLGGKVLVLVQVNQPPALVSGDFVDILVTECNLSAGSGCITQTTLTDVYVYDVSGTSIYLALTNQNALALKYLVETGNVTFAIRPHGDNFGTGTGTPVTTPVNSTYIINNFNFK